MSNSLFLIEYYYSWATKSRPFGTYNVSASATWKSQAVWEILYLVVVASAVRFSVFFLEEFIQPYFTPGSGWVIPFLQPTEEDHAEDRPRRVLLPCLSIHGILYSRSLLGGCILWQVRCHNLSRYAIILLPVKVLCSPNVEII